ncbi:MAG: hypothetical protein ACI945_002294 [Pseudohongiellaceae bacterium]|jgi:hypothetical protein
MGLGAFNELNLTDPQPGTQVLIDNKNGFFKLTAVLAIVIPLSFIAHSLFNSANAKQLTTVDLLTNPNKATDTDLTRLAAQLYALAPNRTAVK